MLLKAVTIRATLLVLCVTLPLSAHAVADIAKQVDIDAGDLAPALLELSNKYSADLVYRPEQVYGLKTHGAHGSLSTAQAVTKLLEGTKLKLTISRTGAMLITAPGSNTSVPEDERASTQENGQGSESRGPKEGESGSPSSFRVAQVDQGQATSASTVEGAPPASAEQSKPPSNDAAGVAASVGAEVTVTATRVSRADYSAPTPTVAVGAQQLEQFATTNLANYLDTVPMFSGSTSSTTTNSSGRSAGANYLDLRGLGPSRTLVLVDGLRFVPEADIGLADYHVDLNQIPSLLIDHVEVVTGGASAQWGSDAVAGVVNILLVKNFEGLRATAQAGQSAYGDNGDIRSGFLAGKNFMDNRLNVTVAADFEKNYGVEDAYGSRPWGRKGWALMTNPCAPNAKVSATCPQGPNGLATNLILSNVQFSSLALGGVITNTALKGTTFGAGGVPLPFQYGQLVGGTYMYGGGQQGINQYYALSMERPSQRQQVYSRLSYQLSDNVTAYAEASYALSQAAGQGEPYDASLTIQRTNAYLPASIASYMQQNNIASFTLGRVMDSAYIPQDNVNNHTWRAVMGLDGKLGDSGWKWTADAGFGENRFNFRASGESILANLPLAVDSVVNPANGQVTCRALVPGSATYNPVAAAGCIPMDVFGPTGTANAAASYVTGTLHANIDYRQTFANVSISGEPFDTWAGAVSVAAGFDYRNETEDAVSDQLSNSGGWSGSLSSSFNGSFNVKEAFAETVIPLLKDSILGKSLELNGAVRRADYSGPSGGQTPWKVGMTYRPVEALLLRAARSLDIRAPNIYERELPSTTRKTTVNYGGASPQALVVSSGNPNLVPEKALTTTYGFAFTPDFVPGFAFSLDHWQIDTKNLIATIGGQDVANACLAGKQDYCQRITFDSTGLPTQIDSPYLNLAVVDISGWDAEASYRFPLNRFRDSLPGALTFSLTGTNTKHAFVNSGALNAPTIDRAGENGPINQFAVPHYITTGSLTYSNEQFETSVRARSISGGNFDNTFGPTQINNNHVGGITYIDLTGSYEVSSHLRIFGVVNNLFNRWPPIAPTAAYVPTNPARYDVLGRVYTLGVRYER